MKWKSHDHVSPKECSAGNAGLPPNYKNLEKKMGAKLVSVHIPNYVLLYNLSAVIVWRKSRVTCCVFGGKSDQYMRSAFLRSMFLSDISKIHSYVSANFVGDLSPLQRLACQ